MFFPKKIKTRRPKNSEYFNKALYSQFRGDFFYLLVLLESGIYENEFPKYIKKGFQKIKIKTSLMKDCLRQEKSITVFEIMYKHSF